MAIGGAQQYFDVQADLATFSKAMANGYAVSAITGKADVLQCLGRTHISSTYCTNSAEMAAAVATISILKESNTIEHLCRLGQIFQNGLSGLIAEYDIPVQIVGYPISPFLLFTEPNEIKRETAKSAFYTETTRNGILFHPNHHWYVSAAHTEEQIAYTLEVCHKGFEEVHRVLKSRETINPD